MKYVVQYTKMLRFPEPKIAPGVINNVQRPADPHLNINGDAAILILYSYLIYCPLDTAFLQPIHYSHQSHLLSSWIRNNTSILLLYFYVYGILLSPT